MRSRVLRTAFWTLSALAFLGFGALNLHSDLFGVDAYHQFNSTEYFGCLLLTACGVPLLPLTIYFWGSWLYRIVSLGVVAALLYMFLFPSLHP